ncbi:hypothetical protein [Nocardia gamkensis]|uniref:Crystal protein ET79 n=1 Tax=Nocardia gamkensis TaxID=352869 RepID=A0A7X6R7D2_9NOCA|nr:hypothetical protein [Nocardia gamkensis]NKY31327.1 hypothetical protein [Nocardia gamkensis]NQE72424.1 hypothetical protein [Nocardia gamkensis]
MAARSYWVRVYNYTGTDLTLTNKALQHGVWSNNGGATPPDVIPEGRRAEWGSESDGLATGTEGEVVYASAAGEFKVYWDNPYVGSDQTSVRTPTRFSSVKEDSRGDNATLKVALVQEE